MQSAGRQGTLAEAFFTARADVGLAHIALSVAEVNATMALTVWDEIHAAATRLADGTAIGHRHASIRNVSLHVYLVRRWYLVYEVDTTPLVIRRVVAARRDLVSLRL